MRTKLLAEQPYGLDEYTRMKATAFHKMFRLGPQPDYEPDPAGSAAAVAAREGRQPNEVAYDWMLEDEGRAIIYFPVFNYSYEKLSHTEQLLQHLRTMLSLGDGGAHCGYICDASLPTFMLTHWTRDRARGDKLPLELIVQRQTSSTAAIYGLNDRGLIKPGYIADLNLIDYDRLSLHAPHFVADLPAGGRRIDAGGRRLSGHHQGGRNHLRKWSTDRCDAWKLVRGRSGRSARGLQRRKATAGRGRGQISPQAERFSDSSASLCLESEQTLPSSLLSSMPLRRFRV